MTASPHPLLDERDPRRLARLGLPDRIEWQARRRASLPADEDPARFRGDMPGVLFGADRMYRSRALRLGDPLELVTVSFRAPDAGGTAPLHTHALRVALDARRLEVTDAGEDSGHEHRRQAGGEDEARRVRADDVDDILVGGDIAAHHAERLAQRPLDHGTVIVAMRLVLALLVVATIIFIVARYFDFDTETRSLISDQVSVVLGRDFVLTFQERATGAFEAVRERLRAEHGAMRAHGSDYLAYALLDTLVDRYFIMLDHLSDLAEELEESALTRPTPALLAEINRVKHEARSMRRAVWPLREVLNTLSRADNDFFTADTRLYLRDIYDHTVHVLESLESVRDLLADLLDIYLSSVSNRLNTEVRILTVLTTLFMPATLIAGIFGMNFRHMPLLDDQDGFRLALGMMIGAATAMAAAFWRRNWLKTR